MMRKSALSFIVAALILSSVPALASGGYSEAQIKDILLRLMNFAVFFAFLFYVARKPIAKFFAERREGIARNLEYLETQARNLEEQTEIMNRQIADIASERDAIIAKYERQGQKEAERIIAEAKLSAEAIVQKTQAAMELEIKAARQTLTREIVRLSTQAATELVKSNINQDDQKRLTSEFMDQVATLKAPEGQRTAAE
ncbi:ATP synthase F0 subunit B [Deltaproteobacteria bacterium OttesenSCG-928-K17]|nr:ATP synthase F0 subunit B [Deltaproteobacteria bacterium OttesenSCG-928-K17]